MSPTSRTMEMLKMQKLVRWVIAYSTGRKSTIINSNPSAVLREEKVAHPSSSLLQYKAAAF